MLNELRSKITFDNVLVNTPANPLVSIYCHILCHTWDLSQQQPQQPKLFPYYTNTGILTQYKITNHIQVSIISTQAIGKIIHFIYNTAQRQQQQPATSTLALHPIHNK